MRIAVGSDHAGFALKTLLAEHLAAAGHEILDLGTGSGDVPVDYPRYGHAVGGRWPTAGPNGVCACAGPASASASPPTRSPASAPPSSTTSPPPAGPPPQRRQRGVPGRADPGPAEAVDAVDAFFATGFEGGRHQRRIDQITAYDAGLGDPAAQP